MDIRTDVSAGSPDAAAEHTDFNYITELPTTIPYAYLVDLAKYPEALRLLFERDPSPVYDMPWIYTQTREEAFAGPLLVKPEGETCEEWLWTSYQEGKALVLYGRDLTLKAISQHLVTLNKVVTPFGESLFRYADSASLGTLGASLTALQRKRFLGPLTAIHGRYGDTFWALQSHTDSDQSAKTATTEPLTLTRDNLAAAEAIRKNRLMGDFAASNDYPEALVKQWCRQLEELGAPNEQGLVEGIEVLAHAGFDRPMTDTELSAARNRSDIWSGRLELLAQMTPQEGP